ncbi:MAG: hypothetical protein EPN26_08335 [Rhodospirillales bacterium]|nr:MAG: hypothetical protein EPN26_08335 [Rhodospirillales bacterium]
MAEGKFSLPLHLLVKKFVLVIGDEGAVLVHVVRGNVKNAWFVPIDSEEGPEAIREYLATDKRIPLFVEVDVVEQLYREELLPKSNPFDHPKVLKRRLELAYQTEEMKAAKPIIRKGMTQKPYLFMALPMSDWLKKWTLFLETVPNPVEAYALLPMESLGLVEALAPPSDAKTDKHWRMFISQEVTGGFRQIIQLNGQFILTRMTPKPAEEDTAEDVSQLIEREFKSSISYIKRLGYGENDHLDLVAVVGAPIREALYQRELPVTSLSILTPFEAGKRLGYEKVADPDSPYGDMLHAVWLARKTKPPLKLATAAMKKRQQMRQVEKIMPVAAMAVTAFQLYYAGDILYSNYELSAELEARKQTLAERQSQVAKLEGDIGKSEVPFEKMLSLISAKQALDAQRFDWPELLRKLDTAIEGRAIIWRLGIEAEPGGKTVKANERAQPRKPVKGAQPEPPPSADIPYMIEIDALFHSRAPDLTGTIAQIRELENRFKQALPEASIEVKELPANVKPDGTFTSKGRGVEKGGADKLSATYIIRRGK